MPFARRMIAPPHDARRWAVGVEVSSDCARVAAVVLAVTGRGLQMRAQIGRMVTVEAPAETVGLFRRLVHPGLGAVDSGPASLLAPLLAQLTDIEASLVADLFSEAGMAPARILAAGVIDPGLWSGGYLGLCDAARLAEATGLNVIDAFPARDVACGGRGGPITALPEWILLGHPVRNRLLLDLGRTIRMTYLPADRGPRCAAGVRSFDVGPGMRLLDQLTQRLTGGEHPFDPGGRFAVQGRRIAELIEHWLEDPSLKGPLPCWHPRGIGAERFLLDAMQMGLDFGWSVQDMLCTATHFIAEQVQAALGRRILGDATVDEVLLSGGGQHNGMLLREIAARLPDVPLVRIADADLTSEVLGPASAALLALLCLDQTPAGDPMLTGAEVARVLGRITPGSPQSWQRLLCELTGSAPPMLRPLRSAV